jgi:hypothetical protein
MLPCVKRIGEMGMIGVASVLGALACNEPPAETKAAGQSEPAPAPGILERYEQAKRDTTCNETKMLVSAVELHLTINPGQCPTDVETLVEAKVIPRVPEGSPSWTIACTETEVIVSAPGPDERMGTTDDIVVGGPQWTCPKE